ncbi:MAG: glycosyltransferase family 2 protein [Candidatus Hydrogenedentes bacterium]|nr:glycosyltransferase family 2 protein [Candidatus Hydrogenedentota bacterium]
MSDKKNSRIAPSPEVSVVIPCYNEAKNIPLLAQRVQEIFSRLDSYSYECLFINDGSTDDTREQLEQLQSTDSCVRALHLIHNMGQSAALIAGMHNAQGNYILTLDGDLQNDPEDFPRILELLNDYDCVCGYRTTRNDTWVRRVSSKIANTVRNGILHDGIRDSGCGTKGFRKKCVRSIVPFNGMHRFFAVLVRNAEFSVIECPVAHHPRLHGISKYGLNNRLWRGLFDLVGVAWLRKRYINPRIEE